MKTLALVGWASDPGEVRLRMRSAPLTDRGDIVHLTWQVEALMERMMQLEGQVYRLMESRTVEAEAFVLRDAGAEIRARLDLRDHAPRLTFYDGIGEERLRLGLNMDGTPDVGDLGRR